MTVFGWDASDYDWPRGPMDLNAAFAAGVRFFTYKATESTDIKHQHYGEALNRARAAGIEFLGAYVVPRTGPSIDAQVQYLLDYVNQATPWWTSFPGFFFQVDTEHWGYDNVSPSIGADMCTALRARTGRQVIHYAPQWAYGNSIPGADPLWASNYGTNAVGTLQQEYPGDSSSRWADYSGRTPVFLQFGSQIIIGSQNTCDGNAFRGSTDDLRNLITGSKTPPAAEDDMAETFVMDGDGGWWFSTGDTRRKIDQTEKDNISYWHARAGRTVTTCMDDGGQHPKQFVGADLDIWGVDVATLVGAPGPKGDPGKDGAPGVKGDKGDAAVLPEGATLVIQ